MGFFDSLANSLGRSVKSSAQNAVNQTVRKAEHEAVNAATNAATKAVSNAVANSKTKTYKFNELPQNAAELMALPEAALTDANAVAALAVLALIQFSKNEATGVEMLNALKGPAPLSERDKSFLHDRFDGTSHLPMSYFEGATPQNNYTPSTPYTISVSENPYSRDQFAQGYLTLYLKSGGADSPRPVTLRNKPSSGQWFLWDFASLVSGIRTAVEADPWA
ncbi:MAG: hypothetical protein MJ131_05445 [Lachnospiraceae bacterium]|nr:hypothetical protein [Lachnospiraceae bacterium]